MIADTKINELLALATKATPGPWRWEDDYDFREHVAHKALGLDADCENVRGQSGRYARQKRMTLESNSGTVLSEWNEQAADAGLSVHTEDARFIEACSPETILALVEEVKMHRGLLQ